MPSIQTSARLVKRIALTNIIANEPGLNITPMLSGPHGIGKSQILKSAAAALGGYCFTVECSAMKEGSN